MYWKKNNVATADKGQFGYQSSAFFKTRRFCFITEEAVLPLCK